MRGALLYLLIAAGAITSCSGYRMVVQGVDFDRFSASHTAGDQETGKKRAAHHNDLGVLLEKEGDLEGALRQYRLAIRNNPDLAVAYFNAGNISVHRGRLDEAEGYYRSALRRDPNHSRALNNLAWVYLLRKENIGRAIELLDRALESDPEQSYLYLDSLGWAYYLDGRRKNAVAFLNQALEETPPDRISLIGETHYHLGLIFREEGEREKSRSHLEKCLQHNPAPKRRIEIERILESD